jgi:hypothetical protein
MDEKRFDELSRRIAKRQTRRSVLGLFGVAVAGLVSNETVSAAPKNEKPTKCYGEGSHCTNGKQCCSNICTNRQCTADAGPGPQCTVAADCAGVDDECQSRTCTDGTCGVTYTPYGTPAGDQMLGDCETNVCNGAGGIEPMIDDTDTPPDLDECTLGICLRGVPSTRPQGIYAPCETNGGFVCDGAGHCVVCIPGDTQSCYSGPGGTDGVGVCRAGTQACRSDGSGFDACAGEVLPSPEMCNGLDDNCDGMVDVGVPGVGAWCNTGRVGSCAPGILRCQEGTLRCAPNVVDCCLFSGEEAFGFCSQCCSGACEPSPSGGVCL